MRYFCLEYYYYLMHSEESNGTQQSDINRKREGFRQNIRKTELEKYFSERRKIMLQQIPEGELNEFLEKLKTTADQQKFIADSSLQLTGEPKAQWRGTLSQLKKAIYVFKGNFDSLVTQSIIKQLCEGLKQEYKDLKLAPTICSLISDMVFLSWEHSTRFGKQLMEYEPVPQIVALSQDPICFSLQERLQFLLLLSNLCCYSSKYRMTIARDGGDTKLIEFAKEVFLANNISDRIIAKFFSCCLGFIRCSKKQSKEVQPSLNLVYALNPIVMAFIVREEISMRCLEACLSCLYEAVKREKLPIYKSICGYQGLLLRILSILILPEFNLRFLALNICCHLTYCEFEKGLNQMMELGFLNALHHALNKQDGRNKNNFSKIALITLSNIATSQQRTQALITHEVFLFVIEKASDPEVDTQYDAFSCICTVVCNLKFNNLRIFLSQFQVLRLLARGLIDAQKIDGKASLEIIETIHHIMEQSQKVFNTNNPLLQELERSYNLTALLQRLMDSKNKIISQRSASLYEFICQLHYQKLVPL